MLLKSWHFMPRVFDGVKVLPFCFLEWPWETKALEVLARQSLAILSFRVTLGWN